MPVLFGALFLHVVTESPRDIVKMMRILLEGGADPNSRYTDKVQSYSVAACAIRDAPNEETATAIIELLIEHGCTNVDSGYNRIYVGDINKRIKGRVSDIARALDYKSAVKLLDPLEDERNNLVSAVRFGQADKIEQLCMQDEDLWNWSRQLRFDYEDSPLDGAVARYQFSAVTTLIKLGASAQSVVVAEHEKRPMIFQPLFAGANAKRPEDIAKMMRILLEGGADPNSRFSNKAESYGLAACAIRNARNEDTALDILRLLIEHGCTDVNNKDNLMFGIGLKKATHRSVTSLAKAKHYKQVVKFLEDLDRNEPK